MTELLELAIICGFTNAKSLDVSTLQPREDVRDMCAANKCCAYGKNWMCPPICGTLEVCRNNIARFERGIILQTRGTLEDQFDFEGMMETEVSHRTNLLRFSSVLRKQYPDALILGAGGCKICKTCSYPNPCYHPDLAYSSMEGYGLLVSDVCKKNQMKYYYGPHAIVYTACCLFH